MQKTVLIAAVLFLFAANPAGAQEPTYAPSALPGAGVNYETRLSNIEDQMRALTGKVEQLDYAVRRLDQALQRMQADYEQRLAKLETAPPQVAVAPPATKTPTPAAATNAPSSPSATAAAEASGEPANPEESVTGTLGGLKVRGEKVTGAVANPKAPPLPETPPDYGLTPQEQYDRAFGLLRQANYEEAERAFKTFIDKNPQDKLLGNAKYWYAETFYVRAKFSDAAVAFADAWQQEPKGTKAPDSLLKLAMALGALDKTDDACSTLASLKAKYPTAPESVRARAEQERMRMKCGKKQS
jgi:tol-pal system protein YbgF